MKFLIALLIIIPTLIAVLLFTVAAFAYNNPTMLAAVTNPTVAILCIISGVIATLPLLVAIIIGLTNQLLQLRKRKNRTAKTNGQIWKSGILESVIFIGTPTSKEGNKELD